MKEGVWQALQKDRLVDITTTGRKTGQPRRVELGFHLLDGKIFLSGRPGRRGWYANLLANPEFTFHLKQSVKQDLRAKATPIPDEAQRRAVLTSLRDHLSRNRPPIDVEAWVAGSPLVEVELLP
ncbi:MAG: nitroreductase family deazaflavin-dependent oxidoreductase [Chloroflexi bacterium]|nr:nitroreductase family deazaflavin-dependent oxidoreductase [Chloroflexota bacterium]